MRNRKTLPVVAALLLALNLGLQALAQTPAPALPPGVERITSVEGITEYRLPNGMQVLLFPDQTKQTLTVNVTYLVGSRHENYGETGMAHLLEHMLFKGTPKHPAIPKELEQRGASYNASTSFDRTNYYETLPATEDNLRWMLEFEADRMVNSTVLKKDLDSEMTVVRNEFEIGENNPISILQKRVLATAYTWHNYAHLPIGARSDIENVPIERLQAFYHQYYQPDNSTLLIAGKFDAARALALVQESFGAIAKPARVLPKLYTVEPAQDGDRTVLLRRVGDVQAAFVVYHIPDGANPDLAAIKVLTGVLGDPTTGRLHKALVEAKKATVAGGSQFQLHDPGVMFYYAMVNKGDSLDAARDTLLQTVEDFSKNPPTKDEVEHARAALLSAKERTLNDSGRVGAELSEWISQGDWRLFFLDRDRIRKVTPEDVLRVATAYLKTSNRTLGLFYPVAVKPELAEIPSRSDVEAMLKGYKGEAAVAAGEAFDPSPANIESRTTRTVAHSGLKLALLPKKTRGATVSARLALHFGDEKSLMNRGVAGGLAADMLDRGTTKHTRQQLKEELDRLKARVGIAGSATGLTVSLEAPRENLPAVMKLMAEMLRESNFPASEFDQLKQESLAGIEQSRHDPASIAITAFNRHLSPYPKGHVKYVATPDEELAGLKAVTLDDVKKFYADFYGAQAGEMAVVGDFDDKALTAQINELFGNWQNKTPYKRISEPYREIAAVNQTLETPDKANAVFIAGENLNLSDTDPAYPALLLADYLIGSSSLHSRLGDRIRQQEGLSYSVGSQLEADPFDHSGQFTAFAMYAPQNNARLEAAFKDEMAKVIKDGFTADEIKTAKSGWLQSRQVARSSDRALSAMLSSSLYTGRTMMWQTELEQKVEALTPEQILAAVRRYLDPARLTIIKAGDFAKAGQKP